MNRANTIRDRSGTAAVWLSVFAGACALLLMSGSTSQAANSAHAGRIANEKEPQ